MPEVTNPNNWPVKVFGPFRRSKDNPVLYYRWRFEPPRLIPKAERQEIIKTLYWVSTGTTDMQQAARRQADDHLLLNSPRYWAEQEVTQHTATKVAINSDSVKTLWSRYTTFIGKDEADRYIRQQGVGWHKFWKFIELRNATAAGRVRFLSDVTPEICADFRNWAILPKVAGHPEKGGGCSMNTVNTYRAYNSIIWDKLISLDATKKNPWTDVTIFSTHEVETTMREVRALELHQAACMLPAVIGIDAPNRDPDEIAIFVALLLYAGLRHTEAEAARGDWLVHVDGKLVLQIPKMQQQENGYLFRTKTRKSRQVPVHSTLAALLQKRTYFPTTHLVKPNCHWKHPRSTERSGARHYFPDVLVHATAKLEDFPADIVPHHLRHSFITEAHRRGIPATTVMQWVGHSIPGVHGRYVHLAGYDPAIDLVWHPNAAATYATGPIEAALIASV